MKDEVEGALRALRPGTGPDPRVQPLIDFFHAQIGKVDVFKPMDHHHEGAQLAMLAINALATDNRLDERRTDILGLLDAARKDVLTNGPPSWTHTTRNSDTTAASSFLRAVDHLRFPVDKTSIAAIDENSRPATSIRHRVDEGWVGTRPNPTQESGKPSLDSMIFCTVSDASVFKWANRANATFAWKQDARFADIKLEDSLQPEAAQVETFRDEIESAMLNRIVYPTTGFINPNLTWLSNAGELESMTDKAGSISKIADAYRDRAGLGHQKKGTHLFASLIPGRLLRGTKIYRPRFCDNPDYPWFMVGAPDRPPVPEGKDWQARRFGQTCCLKSLRCGRVASGLDEIVVHGLHGSHLQSEEIEVIYLGKLENNPPNALATFIDQMAATALDNERRP